MEIYRCPMLEKEGNNKMAKKNKKEGTVAKTLRTWSPGKYIGKFIKGEPIGVSKEKAEASKKKAAAQKEKRKSAATKRTKAHKESVAKKDKGTGAKDWYPGKYVKKFVKGEPIGVPKSKQKAAPKVDKAVAKTAVKKAAPQPFGKAFSSARKGGEKTFTWKGKSYSTKTADDVKKEKAAKAPKKVAPKKVAKPAPSGPESPVGKKEYEAKPGQESTMQRNRPKKTVIEPYPPREDQGPKFAEGGKVESNPYGWPSRDARNGGKG